MSNLPDFLANRARLHRLDKARQKSAALPAALPDEDFAAQYLYILDKHKHRCPLVFNFAQKALIERLTGKDIVIKARQLGISTALQARDFKAVMAGSQTTITLAHDDRTTQALRRMADFFYKNLPPRMQPRRAFNNATIATYPDLNSEKVIATAGSANTGRGFTATRIHGSEVCFWKDPEAIIAGLMQAGDPAVILESTANGATGYIFETVMEALDHKNDWNVIFMPWWFDLDYRIALEEGESLDYSDDELRLIKEHGLTAEQIKFRRTKQRELKHLFPQEYAEDVRLCFLMSGLGYFGDIEHCYTAPTGATPQEGHKYVAGLDWGQIEDWTVMPIGDAKTRQQVEIVRIHQMPYPDIRKHLISRLKYWGVNTLYAEVNSASGNVDSLRREAYEAGLRLTIIGYETSNESKAVDMSALRDALTEGVLGLLPDEIQKAEMRALQVTQTAHNNWRIAAAPGQHDDIPIGNMLMWKALAWGHDYIPPKAR